MRKVLVFTALLAIASFALAGVSKADSCPALSTNCTSAGGVTYTFNPDPLEPGGVTLTIDTKNAIASGTLTSFSVQFDNSTGLVLDSSPTGTWMNAGQGPNTSNGCDINGSANHWCIDTPGAGITVTAGPGGGLYTFEFDVTGGNLSASHIQAFQGQGALAISNDVGVGGGSPSPVPEPASLTLLVIGLAGITFLTRRK